jgi:hypothetical protein
MYKHGEIKCEAVLKSGNKAGHKCENGAYFSTASGYLCGVHSKKLERQELPKFSKVQKLEFKNNIFDNILESASIMADANYKNKKIGSVSLYRLGSRFSKVTPINGVLDVYPNFMSTYQGIGIVCPELSPMKVGPIIHSQKGLPNAQNLENFYQYSKFYNNLESKTQFKELQVAGFTDSIPHRRKYKKTDIPDCFIWIDSNGIEQHLTYLQSRQFYANYYQRGIQECWDFIFLKHLICNGYNLRICGPDAYPLKEDSMSSYCDITVPRGHEFCLYEMLTNKDGNYPWIILKTFDF